MSTHRVLRVIALSLAFSVGSSWPSTTATELTGSVVSVLDGDTLEVLNGHHTERIRLKGIDCPEKGQPYGNRAKQAASALAFGKEVMLQTHGKDRYGRTIADVFLSDGTNVNHELVKEGWCWWYRKYAPGNTDLEKLEKEAREDKKGLWADPSPVHHGHTARPNEASRLIRLTC